MSEKNSEDKKEYVQAESDIGKVGERFSSGRGTSRHEYSVDPDSAFFGMVKKTQTDEIEKVSAVSDHIGVPSILPELFAGVVGDGKTGMDEHDVSGLSTLLKKMSKNKSDDTAGSDGETAPYPKGRLIAVVLCALFAAALFTGAGIAQLKMFAGAINRETTELYSRETRANAKYISEKAGSARELLTNIALRFAPSVDGGESEADKVKVNAARYELLSAYLNNSDFESLSYITRDGEALTAAKNVFSEIVGARIASQDMTLADSADSSESGGEKFSTASVYDRDYFKQALLGESGIYVSGSYSEGIDTDYVILSVPVFLTDGEVGGVLAAVTSKGKIFGINAGVAGTLGERYVVDANGNIVYSDRDDSLGISYNIFNHINDAGVSSDINLASRMSESSGILRTKIAKNETGSRYSEVMLFYVSLDLADWVNICIVSVSDVYGSNFALPLYLLTIFTLVLTVAAVVFAAIFYLRARRIITGYADKYESLVSTDPVTGHYTIDKFITATKEIFRNNPSKKYALVSVDINKFRAVNDFLGHDVGNTILKRFAGIIDRSKSPGDIFTRGNADTFYLLLHYATEDYLTSMICNVIRETEYHITEFRLVLSFGIYYVHDKTMEIRAMFDRADLARRSVKNHNESSFSFFDANMLLRIREEEIIEDNMEQALECGEFKVYLQPKFDLHVSTLITGAEALVRWQQGDKLVPPGKFIPLFERNGFIKKLDRYIFEEVCKQQKIWLNRGFNIRVISVNMSRANLDDPTFVQNLADICQRYNLSTKYFEIEITESVAFENLEVLIRVFNELKHFGFHISIDDFGTGYSSLNMLKDLHADVLKIDRAFLTDAIDPNDRASAIISHVISLALALKMKTICEGIETFDQAKLLNNLGCDMAQGFYFAKPMPIPEFERRVFGTSSEF